MEEEVSHSRRRKFKLGKKSRILLILVIGLIIGMILQNQFVEPVIGQEFQKKFTNCEKARKLLDSENNECFEQLSDVNSMLRACNFNLTQCREQ